MKVIFSLLSNLNTYFSSNSKLLQLMKEELLLFLTKLNLNNLLLDKVLKIILIKMVLHLDVAKN